ncbi:PQQ-binding-like beta-propeller repeat protein [Streptomyces sp. NPDC059385]|uniref:outer membrane protein assembly factor BamB family protein n=1 Tax=Streptomyces sp. NPDC059385 TaxID=3346817 RepID=UPI00368D100E
MDEVFVNSISPASRWASSALLLMAAVAGCTSQPNRSTDSPKPAHAVFDPPSTFDAKAGVPMPKAATAGLISSKGKEMELLRNPVALFKEKAYVATRESLLAVDTTSGAVTTITPEATPVKAPEADGHGSFLFSQPVSITEGDGPLVLASFVVQQPASGTHSARVFVEVTAVNAASGRVEWRLPLSIPEWAKDAPSPLGARIIGSSGRVAVVRVGALKPAAQTTYAIDLVDHRVLWTRDLLNAQTIAKGTVLGATTDAIGSEYEAAAGYDLNTGEQRWRGEDSQHPSVGTGGPNLVTVAWRSKTDVDFHRLVDPQTGAVKQELPEDFGPADCDYDGISTLICFRNWKGLSVRAFDTANGELLWQLPNQAAGRIAPRVTAVWHGRIYGSTQNGPLALDARTGEDLPTPPGIAPYAVNEYVGLALKGTEAVAYPAIG